MRKLRALDIPHIAVNLEPVFGSIDDYAQIIDAAVSRMQVATGQPVVLVGHSMGGLAIRGWLRRFDSDVRVRRVVTIGSPHHGTWLARFGHTQNGKQMRQRSAWLTRLAAEEPVARYEHFTCFYGHCDNIVFPASTAMLPGAENLHVPVTAHVDMAFHPVVFKEALRWLSAAPVASTLTSADAR
jgi:triacylglycerol esterase/lipase EstA (alpha/beta hydrolase family)